MKYEVIIKDKTFVFENIRQEGNKVTCLCNGEERIIDIVEFKQGFYSIIDDKNKSHNLEAFPIDSPYKYLVYTEQGTHDVEVVDAKARYAKRRSSQGKDGELEIATPMPGKVVKIFVKVGDKVKAGDILITVSAMKMESEYKAQIDATVKDITVSEGDAIEGNVPMILLERED